MAYFFFGAAGFGAAGFGGAGAGAGFCAALVAITCSVISSV
jgi:hypothetical protein